MFRVKFYKPMNQCKPMRARAGSRAQPMQARAWSLAQPMQTNATKRCKCNQCRGCLFLSGPWTVAAFRGVIFFVIYNQLRCDLQTRLVKLQLEAFHYALNHLAPKLALAALLLCLPCLCDGRVRSRDPTVPFTDGFGTKRLASWVDAGSASFN